MPFLFLAYNRTWESAKNRFIKTILKNLQKYCLEKDVVEKFKLGAVAVSKLIQLTLIDQMY